MLDDLRGHESELGMVALKGEHVPQAPVLGRGFFGLGKALAEVGDFELARLCLAAHFVVIEDQARGVLVAGLDAVKGQQKRHGSDPDEGSDPLPHAATVGAGCQRGQGEHDERSQDDLGSVVTYAARDGQSLQLTTPEIF